MRRNEIKKILTLVWLFLLLSNIFPTSAQDATFTQWENMPVHFNPSLTGNFEGLLRFRAKYRDQWRSVLEKSAYKTSAVSFEYKFKKGSKRKLSIGTHSILESAGQSSSGNSFNFSTSISQNLGNVKRAHHKLALGFNLGIATNKLDLDKIIWPPGVDPEGLKSKNSYPDFSTGFNWQYISDNHFQIQLGSGIAHLNRPNISFSETGIDRLYIRYSIHGNAEIPLMSKASLSPSFLYLKQGIIDQLLFGLAGKIYFISNDNDFFQIGLYAKTTQNYYGTDLNIFVLSTMMEFNSILFGFSVDHFQSIKSNAYEFSIGYILGK